MDMALQLDFTSPEIFKVLITQLYHTGLKNSERGTEEVIVWITKKKN